MMKLVTAALGLALVFPGSSLAQQPDTSSAHQSETLLQTARDVMQRARYCTLVTVGEDGHPQARIVDPFPAEERMVVWIATKAVTRKVSQIRRDPRVTLLCFDTQGLGYVSLLGTAQLVDDPKEKAARWKDEWESFYSDRNRGEDYLLIRVQPARLEILSAAHGIVSDPQTWRPALIEMP